jgi:hypothetical protein
MPGGNRVEGFVADARALVGVCLRHGAYVGHLVFLLSSPSLST